MQTEIDDLKKQLGEKKKENLRLKTRINELEKINKILWDHRSKKIELRK